LFEQISTQASKLISLTRSKNKTSKTKVIAITSGKGGVGKSTCTANISYLFAKENKKIIVVDADMDWLICKYYLM